MDSSRDFSKAADIAEQLEAIFDKMPEIDPESIDNLDHEIRSAITRITGGLSPLDIINAYTDWLGHLAVAPGKREKLRTSLQNRFMELGSLITAQIAMKEDPPQIDLKDSAFSSEGWQKPPFNLLAKAYTSAKEWVDEATDDIAGAQLPNSELVGFINHQVMELLSPANIPFTNPEIIEATREEKGQNLVRGMELYRKDMEKGLRKNPPPDMGEFKVGENLGVTPGKVIYQNSLMELIQYKPTTKTVMAEPVLLVPAWIMKYYILDLVPKKSMVKYLVDQGHTVFTISWKNPTEEDREVSLDDYLNKGLFQAIKAVQAIVPNQKINAIGYCIGGTLLSIGAATLAREDEDVLNSITLFAAQVDFTEAGEIKQLLNASQLSFLESQMWTDGYLPSQAMGSAFKALRPRELIWNEFITRYYKGQESPPNELMAWNADGTRMPYKMHYRYLKELYIENRLADCRFEVNGKPISLQDISAPLFVVGTTTDHVAPWKSVFKISRLACNSEVTFLLTNGGHNAGIISGPEHPRRKHQVATRRPGDKFMDPNTWQQAQPVHAGSWWPTWSNWLSEHNTNDKAKPRRMGASAKGYKILRDAPGEYVLG